MKRAAVALLIAGCAPAKADVVRVQVPSFDARFAPPKPVTLPAIVEEKHPNGLTVLVIEDHELPVVSMRLLWSTGAEAEPKDKAGLASLASQLLRQGTRTRSAETLAGAIDSTGGSLEGAANVDSTRIGVEVLTRDFTTGLTLLADVAMWPVFPEAEIEDFKRQMIAEVRQAHDDPSELGRRHLRRLVYGNDHPYARFPTEKSIASITRADLQRWHRTRLTPGNATLVVSGDVTTAEILPRLRSAFAGWEHAAEPLVTVADAAPTKRRVLIVDKPDLTQSTIRIAHLGMRRSDPDYHATAIANYVLGGGGFSSRLLRVLRSEEGKTYGVGSGFTIHKGVGPFGAWWTTRTEETVATLDTVLAEMEKIRTGGVTPAELAAAKSNLIGRYPAFFETPQDVASQILVARLLSLPIEEVESYRTRVFSVTIEDVNAAAAQRFHPADAAIVIVGNAKEIRAPIEAKYGSVEVVKWTEEI